jgi:hypothetical protein
MRFVRLFPCLLLSALVASPLAAVTRQMFLTSVAGTGKLSTWADAGGFTGLDAGDAICQARAAAAGLPNAAGYRAWLSDAVDDAYCRLHNLGGKRATNCGQPTLPAAAGPWWRTDGKPFGAGLPDLLHPLEVVLNPPFVTEFATPAPRSAAWTGTDGEGTAHPATCGDWTSEGADLAGDGYATRTAHDWSLAASAVCSSQVNHLYCFETGVADPLPPFPASGRLAFLTSAHGSGNLGGWSVAAGATGLAAGDAICRNLATAAGIRQPGSFTAWLSAAGTNAIDRFDHEGPWMRLDGIEVAASFQDLTDGALASPINLTENGTYLNNWAVWTGTLGAGFEGASHCSSWVEDAASSFGEVGIANSADLQWTFVGSLGCDFEWGFLYCLQDLPLLFLDGFESAGTQAWSATVP